MAHIIVEYSRNLEGRIAIRELLQKVHEAALESGVFEIGGLRTRAEPRDAYVVADGHKDNAFVAVRARIGHGRDTETRKRAAQMVFDALCAYLSKVCENTPLAISLELQEIDPLTSFKKNNLHAIVKERAAGVTK
jgi:5-carboxymethyl-2-hydroxymuconate isomerase